MLPHLLNINRKLELNTIVTSGYFNHNGDPVLINPDAARENPDIIYDVGETFQMYTLGDRYIKENIGDTLWYAAMICNYFNWNMDKVLEENVKKLQKRYPKGLTAKALQRKSTRIDWNEK